jgi:AraC-like DNA-binding protein
LKKLVNQYNQVLQLNLFDVGCNQVKSGWIHEKIEPFTILAQAISGNYEIVSSKHGHIITNNTEVFLAPANTSLRIIHHGQNDTNEMKFRFIHLQFTVYNSIDIFDLYELPPKTNKHSGEVLGNLIGEALELSTKYGENSFIYLAKRNEIAFKILSHLINLSTENENHFSLISEAKNLLPILAYIQDNLSFPISIENLLRLSPISRTNLFMLFKKYLGKTPMEYIKYIRLHEAYKALCVTSDSIGEISEQYGFVTINHFSREFKKEYKKTPLQVRRENNIWTSKKEETFL